MAALLDGLNYAPVRAAYVAAFDRCSHASMCGEMSAMQGIMKKI